MTFARKNHFWNEAQKCNSAQNSLVGEWREAYALDQFVLFAVVVDFAGDRSDGVHRVAIFEIVIGLDFNFLVGRTWAAGVVDQAADRLMKLKEGVIAGERIVVELNAGQLAAGSSAQSNFQQWSFARRARLAGRRRRHANVEIALRQHDFEGKHKEHQQLKHDVNHRCHLQRNGVAMFGVTNFHEGESGMESVNYQPLVISHWSLASANRSFLALFAAEGEAFELKFLAGLDDLLHLSGFCFAVGADDDGHVG